MRVSPGELHFNAAHFITFGGTCENLHGHNFHVRVEAWGESSADAYVIDFVQLTRLAAGVCRELHDGVLLPGESREIRVEQDGEQVVAEGYGKRFVLPAKGCIILPLPNTTAEMLASHIADRLLAALEAEDGAAGLECLEVAVEEADDQWGVCMRRLRHEGR